MFNIEFTKGELECLVHLTSNLGIWGCNYDEAIRGIRKLQAGLEQANRPTKGASTRSNGKRPKAPGR